MAVNIQKFLPPAKSYGNIEKYSRANNEISPVISENLSAITVKVIDVDKILKGTLASDKKELDDKKKEDNLKKRQKAEEALEAKPDKKGGDKLSLPKLPKMGFLDWIKNFISNMILGFFAVRMIEHLPKLRGILSLIGNATDLAIDLGGKFLNGLVTFIDWGYKAYDATRGFLKDLGGENFTKVFDGFVNVIDDVIEAAIIASIAISSFRDEKEPDLGPGGKPGGGKTPLKTGKELYAEYDPKRSLIRKNYGDAAARIYDNEIANGKTPKQALLNLRERYIKKGRILPQRALRLGEIQGSKVLGRGLAKAPQRAATKALVGAFGKGGAKTVLKFIRPFLKRIPIPVVGALIDFGLSVALDEKPGRAAFKAIGSGLAGIIGTAIGSIPPLAIIGGPLIGAALGGWAGDALGGALYDAFFENKKPKQQAKPKVQGRSEGGVIEELFAPKFAKGGLNSFNIPTESFDLQSSSDVFGAGLVKGQKGIDKIPTMLPEGAFVMSRGAVKKHGVNTLESMNASASSFGGKVVNQTKSIFNTANSYIKETNVLGSLGAASGSMLGPLGMLMGYLLGSKGGESIVKGMDKFPKMFVEGGEVTRGGKFQGEVQRTLEKGKYKREIAKKPGEVRIDSPGSEVGGKEKILKLFPDPFESLSGKKDENPQEYVNPFNIVKSTGENLGKSDYFGPILSITAKYLLGQEPDQRDYKNVGLGINLLISKGIEEGKLKGGVAAAFAEGGSVDSETLSAVTKGGDITDWVATTFKKATETNAQKTLREIQENLKLKKPTGGGPGEQPPETSPDSLESGPAGSSGDALTMARNLMRDLGLTEAQAAGIVGNMIAESGVENARPQGSSPGTKGPLVVDGKTGYGIVQWTSEGRQQSLYNFAKKMGHDMSKPLPMNIEYKFFLKEFRENYGSVLEQIKKARDVKTASTIFMQQYEIPAGYKTQAKIMERYNLSQPLYQKLSSGQGTATDYAITDRIGPTLKGKFGLLSLGGTGAPGGDRTLGASSTFADTHKHHNKPDSDPYNRGPNRINKIPRDYVITRGDQSKDRGAPVPSGVSGKVVHASGHTVVVQDGGRDRTQFHHFDRIMARVGQSVSPRTILGTQGNAGTGVVHVHLDASAADHTRWIQGIKRSAFHGENFGIVPKGGLRLNLHEGEMFKVVDKDSVDLLGFDLTKEIIDIENKAQLVARAPSIIEKLKTISGYASYEDQQTVVVIDDGPDNVSYQGDSIGGVSGLSGYGIENAAQDPINPMFESTYASR